MKKILPLILLIFLLITSLCSAKELDKRWYWFFSNSEVTEYVDTETLTYDASDDIADCWILQNIPNEQKKRLMHMKIHFKTNKIQIFEIALYPIRGGSEISHNNAMGEFITIIPSTDYETLKKVVAGLVDRDNKLNNKENNSPKYIDDSNKIVIPSNEKNPLEQANQILIKRYKPVIAISKFDENGFVGLTSDKEIIIYNKPNDMIASVPYTTEYFYLKNNYEMYSNGSKSYDPVIFTMTVINDDKDNVDENLGKWHGNNHLIPMYVLYDLDSNNNIKAIQAYSANSLNPSHYHETINNGTYVLLAKTLFTHADSLNKDIELRKIRFQKPLNNY